MNIIIRIITGALQDADDNSYRRVVQVYLFLAAAATVIGGAILVASYTTKTMAPLQWTRKMRQKLGSSLIGKAQDDSLVVKAGRTRVISICCFGALGLLVLGSWAAYIWGCATGHNS